MPEPKRAYKFRELDPVDAEQIQETLDSPGWAHVLRGLINYRDVKMRELARDAGEVVTAKIRGQVEAIERAMAMPEALIAEARKGAKKE